MDDAVHSQQLHLLALRPSDILAHLIVAGAAVGSLWRLYPPWAPCFWIGALLLVLLVRERMQRRFQQAQLGPRVSRLWGRWFTYGALATGTVWSLLASVFVVTNSLPYQVLALALIGGMTIAGIARNAASTSMMIAFVAPVLVVGAGALLVHPDSFHISIALMLGAFGIVLTTAGRSIHHSVNSDLRLTLELVKTGTTLAKAQGVARTGSWELDATSRRLAWSEEMFGILGLEPSGSTPSVDVILGRVHPDDRARVETALNAWLSGQAGLAVDHRVHGGGRWVHQFGLTQRDAEGRPLRYTAIVQDITDKKQAEETLQFANVVMRTQLEAAEDGILVVSKDRRVISFNERFARLYGCPIALLEDGLYDGILEHILGVTKNAATYRARVETFNDWPGKDGHDDIELVDGRSIHGYTVTLKGPEGAFLGRAWFFRDVTAQKDALAQALEASRLDQLTGLTNRGAFVENLRAAIATAARGEARFAILYLDLDHFKDVNDALGHPAGDELLRGVAERLRSNTRALDTVARFGGDEFAIIASDVVDLEDASRRAGGLIDVISEPYAISGIPVRVTASIGIALYGPDSNDAETMLSHADLALYSAKADGRSEHRPFTMAMDTEVRTRVAVGAELHDAIAQDQLFLLYQPQIDVSTRRVVGVEALVRWRHPVRGVLGPGVFIPVAEQTGVIVKLGHWVLATACRQAKAWRDAGAPSARVAINVSSLQFKTALAFEAEIYSALAENDLSPEHLELELTETVLMNAFKDQAAVLMRLRDRGITIAIDDFGTGYSSLDYLRRFPVNRIKIAQEFVRDLETAAGDVAIVKATIGLARALGIDVIAEGVERQRQLELLQEWGCNEVQGYYLAMPLPADQIAPLLVAPIMTPRGAPTGRITL